MAMKPFLAVTPGEFHQTTILPEKIAWMACHFSPYGRGLSNLPRCLPRGSLLMVDDVTPIHGHDPEFITQQLIQCSESLDVRGILLDFQRPENPETAELVQYLSQALPCPLAVAEEYAEDSGFPVFISPVPPSVPVQEHLAKWSCREVWLDISTWGEVLKLTETGCEIKPLSFQEFPETGFMDEHLHCHYKIEEAEDCIRFRLWRTEDDLSALLEEAESLGVVRSVGLYQEFASVI